MSLFSFSAVGKGRGVAAPAKPPAKPVGQQINDLLKSPAAAGKTAGAESVLSISQEAKKLLDAKKEAERERMRQAIQDMREKSAGLAELQKNSRQSQQDKKIAETKARLKELLGRMRSALLMGDKRTAALLAKEASQLAKGLAAALKGGGHAGDVPSVPQMALDGGQAEGAEGVEGVDGAEGAEALAQLAQEGTENLGAEEARAEAGAAQREALTEAEQADRADRADEADEADKAGDAEAEDRDGKAVAAEKNGRSENRALANALEAYKKEMDAKVGEMASKAQGPGLSPAQRKEVAEIKQMLRAILSMAKSLLRRDAKGPGAEGTEGTEGADAAEARKMVEAAEKDIEEALEEIDAA
jgi:colicin import membrane protein